MTYFPIAIYKSPVWEKRKGRVVYLDCWACAKDILGIRWVLSESIWSLLNLVAPFWPDLCGKHLCFTSPFLLPLPLCVTWSSYTLGDRPGVTIMYGLRQHYLVYDQLYGEIYTVSVVLHVEIASERYWIWVYVRIVLYLAIALLMEEITCQNYVQ